MKISRFADPTGTVYRFLIAFLVYLIGGFPTLAYALPQGGTIASGAGTIDTSGSALTVNQTTNKIIINWESFSIGNNESVIFLQPDSSSSALNNVLGTSRTVVEGNLSANGQIVLSNPNGIFISPTANINVASLIASTLKISEQDFLDGLYKFSQDPSKPLASILNEGKIRASDFAALIAPSVDNKGVVIANLGTVGLVSGQAVTVDFVGDNLIKFTINEPVEGQVLDKDGNLISDSISNSGSIQANGGQVILSAKNASSIIKNVINMDGVIEAKTVTETNGRIFLGGGDQGTVRVAGTLNASGEEPGDQGGEITIEGADVIVAEGSIQAKGTDAKGGNITITGTDWVSAGGPMDVSGDTGGNVNITTGGLSLAAPVLARGTTGEGGNININTLFASWEVVSALLDVSGTSGGVIKHFADQQITTSGKYLAIGTDGKGGSIDVTANKLKFMSAIIDASGTMGGGRVRLGGEYQGGKNLTIDEIPNAQTLLINDGANVTAKTTGTDGDGGRIIAWGDRDALVLGHFDVTPGTQTGAGGFVEVSSGDTLTFGGHVKTGIDERTGTLLLDPKNITIEDTRVFDPSSYMIGYGYSSDDNDIDLSESKLAFATLTVGNTAEALTVGETITGGTSGATGVVVLGEAGSTTVTYTVTSGTFQNETITGGTSSVAKVVSAVTASTTYRGNDDGFGASVSLHGKWLAVGGAAVENLVQDQESEGAVFLYSYSDTGLSGGTLQAIIGDGYTGGNNLNEPLERKDYFGTHVSLFTNGKGNGQLVVAAMGEDGFEDALNSNDGFVKGALYLYSFNDVSFAGLTRESRIGAGATGTNEIDLSAGIQIGFDADRGSKTPGADQLSAVSLSEGADGSTRLAVGVRGSDGFNNAENNAGDVLLFTFVDPATLTVGSTGEDLTVGETITGGDSGATGVVVLGARDTTTVTYTVTSGTFQADETITGGISLVSKDVSAVTTGKDFSGGALAAVIGSGYDGTYDGADGNATGNRAKDLDLATPLEVEDFFGDGVALDYDSTLNRHRLAVLSRDDRGKNNAQEQGGVYLFTFTDDSFSGGSHVGTIGHSYDTTASDFDFQITSTKNWGGAMTSVALDGNYLAVGAARSTVTAAADGQVELFSFTNNSTTTQFNNIVNEGTLCTGCSSNAQDVEVVPESGQTLAQNDAFGVGVSLDGNRLVVGASGGDGAASGGNGASGEVHIFPLTHYEAADGSDFDNSTAASQINGASSSTDITIWPSTLEGVLSSGTAVTLQANQDITVTDAITAANAGGAGGALTMQAGRSILINANITTDDGNLTLTANDTVANGVVDAQRGSGNAAITMNTGTTINVGTGTFTATISEGTDKTNDASGDIQLFSVRAATLNVTNSGATSGSDIIDDDNNDEAFTISGNSTFTTTGDGEIALNNTSGHAFAGAVSLNTGTGDAAVVDTSGLDLGLSTVGGTLSATAVIGNMTDSGVLTITGTSAFTTSADGAAISFNENHAFTGAVTITTNDSSGADSDATISAGPLKELILAASTIDGDLTVTSSNATGITDSGTVTVIGTASFQTIAAGADIVLDVGHAITGEVTLNTTGSGGDATLNNGTTALQLGTSAASLATSVSGNLDITVDAAVTDLDGLTVAGTTTVTVNSDNVLLSDTSNDFQDTVNISGGLNILLNDTNDLKLGTISGTKIIIDADGAVTQTDSGSVTAPNFFWVSGSNITLTNTSNNVASFKVPAGTNVAYTDANALELIGSTVTGTYRIKSIAGNITDGGNLAVTGASSFTTSANNATITLNNTNALAGTVTLNTTGSSANAEVDNGTTALILGNGTSVSGATLATSVGGNLTLTTGAAAGITDSGTVTVGGDLYAITDNNHGVVNMDQLAVTGSVDLATNGNGAATVVNATVLDFAASTVGGALKAKATTGNITDSGVLTVAGTASFQTSATDADIDFNEAHAITGMVTLNTTGSGGNAILDNGTLDIVLGDGTSVSGTTLATSVGGNLTLTSGAAAGITDSHTVTVGRNLSATTDANNGVINLGSLVVEGTIALATNDAANDDSAYATVVNNCSLCTDGGLNFALSTVEGNLTATATTGNMKQSGALTIKGASTLTTRANNATIVLDTTTNAFTGALTVTTNDDTGANAYVTIDGGTTKLIIATSTIDGDLTLRTGNAADTSGITDSGTVTVGGNLSVTNDVDNGDIDMGTLAVTGSIALTTQGSGGNAAVVNTTALDLAASSVGGTLGATATSGDITDSGQLTITGAATFTAAGGQSIYLDNLDASSVLFGIHTFSGAVTFNGTGGSLLNVTVRDSTAFDFGAALTLATGGNLILTAAGAVTQTGGALTVPGTTTISAAGSTVTLSNSSNNFTGAVSIDALTVDLEDTDAIVLGASTVTGNYLVTTGAAVTQSGALAITGTTTVSASGQNVTLANTANDFQNAVIVTGADVELVDANAIDLGASTISGDYDVLAKAGNITQSGNLTVNNSSKASVFKTEATNATITLNNAGLTNAFSGTVKLTTTGSSAYAYIDNGTTALQIASDSSVGGDLKLVSGHASGITDSGTLTVGGNLYATTDANSGNITLDGLAVSGKIELNTVVLSNADTAQAGSTSTTIKLATGASTTDDIYNSMSVYISSGTGSGQVKTISDYVGSTRVATVSTWTTTPDDTSVYEVRSSFGDATVVNATGLDFISAYVGGSTFAATATNGTITQDSALNIAGTADFLSSSSGNIILDSAANDFVGAVRFRGGAVVIKDSNDINFGIGDSTAAGTRADSSGNQYALKVYAGDQITDQANLLVTGPTVANIGDGNAWFGTNNSSTGKIVLDNGAHTVDGTWTLEGGIGYTISSASAVVLTAMTLAGDLRVTTTGGTVTDTGVLSVEGLAVISASGFDVTLDGVGTTYNNFQDEVQVIGANVVIKDTSAVELGKSTVSGTYDVTADGTVTQNQLASNPLVITGATTISGTDVTLNNTANNFSSVGVTTIGSDVVLVDADAIVLAASTVTGTYDVTAGGAVTQSGALAITGATTITADSAGTKQDVTLTDGSNDFQGAVGVAGATVQLRDTNDLVLGTTTTTGNYTVTAGGGITDNTPTDSDTEALTIGTTASTRTASFTAGDGEAIILNNVNASSQPVHDFSGALTFAASSGNLAGLTVYAVDAIALAALTLVANGGALPGNLSIQSGTVTQSGAWVIPGTTTISASGTNVTLSNASNDFTGAVSITGHTVTLVDAGAIILGTSTVTENYEVTATAGGGITDSGVLNITGTSTFRAAGGQSILLDQSSTFASAVTFDSGGTLAGVSITDTTDFELQALTLSGNLVVASGGSITQSGNLTIGGTSSFTTSTTNETITLSDSSLTNAFSGAFTLSSTGSNAHVTINNGTLAIVITSASVGGNLTLTSGAAAGITDSGTVTVGGNLVATTDANNGVIDMGTLAVTGTVALATHGTGNATIVNDAGLVFATSTIGGNLIATANTLNIADSGTLTVTGATNIYLGTNAILSVSATSATDIYGLTITLDTANNLFTGGITLHYDNVLTDNTDIDLARQVTFAELDFAIDQNITKIYGSYEEMQDDILWMYKLFRDRFPEQEQSLEVVHQPQPNQVKIRKIKANTNKNNASEGKEL